MRKAYLLCCALHSVCLRLKCKNVSFCIYLQSECCVCVCVCKCGSFCAFNSRNSICLCFCIYYTHAVYSKNTRRRYGIDTNNINNIFAIISSGILIFFIWLKVHRPIVQVFAAELYSKPVICKIG